jgi:hypothetical protein
MGRQYQLVMERLESTKKGKSATTISQPFATEDYLLENTRFRVTRDDVPYYQHGDSIKMWVHASDVSGLPLMDGTVKLSIHAQATGYPDTATILHDTLFATERPLDPGGETLLSFSTASFPGYPVQFLARLHLQTAQGETRDTSFYIPYLLQPYYLRYAIEGTRVRVSLIRNMKSVAGTGWLTEQLWHGGSKARRRISYPYSGELTGRYQQLLFEADSTAAIAIAPWADSLQLSPDYVRDTAFLTVRNPQRSLMRYAWYAGSKLGGYGQTSAADTVLRFRTTGGETITVLSNYFWRGEHNVRTPIYKWDRNLTIDVTKKDIIFPGQRDTIGIALTDGEGVPVQKTNLTVLAFNAQFLEDFTPNLEYRGMLKPSLAAPPFAAGINEVYQSGTTRTFLLTDVRWLAKCGADTQWIYKRVHTSAARLVKVSYPAPEGLEAAFTAYMLLNGTYQRPRVVSIDGKPLFYSFAQGFNLVEAIRIEPGMHTVKLRFPHVEITVPDVYFRKGEMNIIFLKDAMPLMGTTRLARSYALDWQERAEVMRHVQAYALEGDKEGDAFVGQEGLAIPLTHTTGVQILGPIDPEQPLTFLQYGNARIDHWAEEGQILTFRKGMTRVRDAQNSVLSNITIYADQKWPDTKLAFPVLASMDTLKDVRYARKGRLKDTKTLKEQPTWEMSFVQKLPADSLSKYRSRLMLLPRDGADIRATALHELATDSVYLVQYSAQFNLRPGTYEVLVMFNNGAMRAIDGVRMEAGAVTFIPVAGKGATEPFAVHDRMPGWVKNYARLDRSKTAEDRNATLVRNDDGTGSGGVTGKVLDDKSQPIVAALVQVLRGNSVRSGTTTDEDGIYTIKPLPAGRYNLRISYAGYITELVQEVEVESGYLTRVDRKMVSKGNSLKDVTVRSSRYVKPLIETSSINSRSTRTADEVQMMPMRSNSYSSATSVQSYRRSASDKPGSAGGIAGGRSESQIYIVDGIQMANAAPPFPNLRREIDNIETGSGNDESTSNGEVVQRPNATTAFINAFLGNMNAASGLRRNFRDWAIWEPNLWTGKDGKTQFVATYPDNITAWKTYVLAMNEKGFSGRSLSLTKAFKPLSAQLYVPRFLHYGDTMEAVTKILNYTSQPFSITTDFRRRGKEAIHDSLVVNNARSGYIPVEAPGQNQADTAQMSMTFTLAAQNGYWDGEERQIPILPLGVIENRGQLYKIRRDTVFSSRPDSGRFSGLSRITIDASMLDLMLRNIESLKEYPYGCTEQLTTRLLAISYEEEIKRAQGKKNFNNTAVRKAIIKKLAKAQNVDGSFGWFGGNYRDLRVTNYVLSTMERIGDKRELQGILRNGYGFLAGNLYSFSPQEQLTALSTLSAGKQPIDFPGWVARLRDTLRSDWDRLTLARICQEQSMSCDDLIDSVARAVRKDSTGLYIGEESYDWYRNSTASAVMAYRVLRRVPRYEELSDAILDGLLFGNKSRRIRSTAENGLLLSAVVPELLADSASRNGKGLSAAITVSGSTEGRFTSFPQKLEVKNAAPSFTVRTEGRLPVYVNIAYQYFNRDPEALSKAFAVKSWFTHGDDSVQVLKHTERCMLRTRVEVMKPAEYVLVEVPIPAGCVPDTRTYTRSPYEESREMFRDRVAIFCRNLPKGTVSFDVPLEARYKGSYSINPARAEMMYFPEEQGHTVVQRIRVR